MTKILETEWNAFLRNVDFSTIPFVHQLFLKEDESNNLKKYLTLEYHPNVFSELSNEDIFYNKYRYFLKFKKEHQTVNGHDTGLEQRAFKILETGDEFQNVDWKIVKRIGCEIEA